MSEDTNSNPITYTPKTDDEIKQLAVDGVADKVVFGIYYPEDVVRMFMILAFLDKDRLQEIIDLELSPYEYLEKAGPGSVNGLPMFMSMHLISKDDMKKVEHKMRTVQAAIDAA